MIISQPKIIEEAKKEGIIDINDFILQKFVGRGSFGKVYKVIEKGTDQLYAAKVSKTKITNSTNDLITDLSREIDIISKLDHPLVLKFKGYSPIDFKKSPKPVIITEYSSNGTLEDLIQLHRNYHITNSNLYSTSKLIIIYGIASAMSYLHSHNIIHRDLKPANILMNEYLLPKIADFGLSKINHSRPNTDSIITSPKGTPIYMAPEIWSKSEYSKAGDVYAFAFIVFEMMTNQKPLENMNIFTLPIKVTNGYRPEFKNPIPDSYKKLIESCWNNNPSNRPTFDQILSQLKADRGFITESVNEEKFINFVKYIDEYDISFNDSDLAILLGDTKNRNSHFKFIFPTKLTFFSYHEFNDLDNECKKLVIEADDNPEKQFLLGKYLIEGQNLFPKNTMIGFQYLCQSMKNGIIESFIYYCEMLIKGDKIPRNLKKAKKILDEEIKEKDQGTYYLLLGKIYKKENRIDESKECFKKSISLNNKESMYEYSKLLNDNEERIKYFKQAISNDCLKAIYKYGTTLINKQEKDEEEGIKYIKAAADKGHQKALYSYYKIIEKNKKEEETIKYLKKAAYKGNIDAMFQYAIKLTESINDEKNIKESILFFKKASDAGNLDSIFYYARIFYGGFGVQIDTKKAGFYMRIAAHNGISGAMQTYAFQLLMGDGFKTNKKAAAKYFKLAADKGELLSAKYYGTMLQNGIGIPEDSKEAMKYIKLAADNGDVEAMTSYANILSGIENQARFFIKNDPDYKTESDDTDDSDSSEDIDDSKSSDELNDSDYDNSEENNFDNKIESDENNNIDDLNDFKDLDFMDEINDDISEEDKKEAAKYYKMAADKGDTDAMMYYGNALIEGEGVTIDKEEGIKYVKMAVDKGNTDAMILYSYILKEGDGVPADAEKAVECLKIAIDKGNSNAMHEYGCMLRDGDGIQTDKNEAIKYFKMAIDKDNTDAMCSYGIMLRDGDGVQADKEEAIKYFKMANDKGNLFGDLEYSKMILEEMKNYNKGFEEEEEEGQLEEEEEEGQLEEEEEEEKLDKKEEKLIKKIEEFLKIKEEEFLNNKKEKLNKKIEELAEEESNDNAVESEEEI